MQRRLSVLLTTVTLLTSSITVLGQGGSDIGPTPAESYVHSVVPLFGPESGGTYISLFGDRLVATEGTPHVYLEKHGECSVVARGGFSNDTVIRCSTPGRAAEDLDSVIIVNIGGLNITTEFTFSYRPDPFIDVVEPRSTILMGGIVQTVTGMNLDSVYAPMLATSVSYSTGRLEILSSPCTKENSTLMLCPMPTIPFEPILRDIWSAPSSVGLPVPTGRIDVRVGFLLDGVSNFAVPYIQVKLHYDPAFNTWIQRVRRFRPYPPINERRIEVTGDRLQACCLDSDFLITVGGETCEIDSRDATTIYCSPPLEEPQNSENLHNAPAVKAFVGYINGTLGYLDYETSLVQSEEFKVGLAVSLLLLLALGLAIFLAYRYVIHLRKKKLDFERRKSFEHLEKLKRKDTMLVTLLPDKLQNRLQGCLIDYDQLEMATELGKGNFGVVFKGFLKQDEEVLDVAVKTIKKNDIGFSDIEEFLQEATITRGFDHPNVLTIIGVSIDRRDCYVVLPFMEKGNLKDLLMDTSNRFNVGELVRLGLQAAKGMEYLESQNFLHRDVAARNCMVGADGVVKIADFGLSRDLYQGNYYQSTTSRPLPVKWMAIECLVNNAVFTTKSDVWSFGVLLWEIITRGVVPYSHIDPRHQLYHLRQGGRLGKPEHCPDYLYNFMLSCWAISPKDRPSFKEIVDFITTLVDPGDESDDENTADGNTPSRGDTSRSTNTQSQRPSRSDTSRSAANGSMQSRNNTARSEANAPSRSDTARTESSDNITSLRRNQRGGTKEDETSPSKPYERLSQVADAGNTDAKGKDYTRLSTVPPYLELLEMPPGEQGADTSTTVPSSGDSSKLLQNENPGEFLSDGGEGVVNPSHVEAPETDASVPPEYLVIVESPLSDSGFVDIADTYVKETTKKKGMFSRNRKDKEFYITQQKSDC